MEPEMDLKRRKNTQDINISEKDHNQPFKLHMLNSCCKNKKTLLYTKNFPTVQTKNDNKIPNV